jgi:hypothetical protein
VKNLKYLVLAGVFLLSGCSDQDRLWEERAAPVLGSTDEVRTENNHLLDGVYWAEIAPVSGSERIVFRVLRVHYGEECHRWALEMGFEDACMNDYEVETYPEAYVELGDGAVITVARPDGPEGNLLIDRATLQRLVFSGSVNGPQGYEWVPFPFLLTVENGYATSAEQIWVP